MRVANPDEGDWDQAQVVPASARSIAWMVAGFCALALLGGATQIEGCSRPERLGPGMVGTATCLACHDGRSGMDMSHFTQGPHKGVSCETCHGPGYAHVRAGGHGIGLIRNPARLPFAQSSQVCAQCHADSVAGHAQSAHALSRGASCHDCHDTHRTGLLRGVDVPRPGPPRMEAISEFCGKCHETQSTQFLESGHAKSGVVTCVSCHDMHRRDSFTADPTDNRLCQQCHGSAFLGFNTEARIDFHTGPFHPVDPAGSGASRCSACHMPPTRQFGQPGVPHDHSMMTVPPAVSLAQAAAGQIPAPNSCAGILGCHDADVPDSGTPFDLNQPDDNRFLQELYESIGGLP